MAACVLSLQPCWSMPRKAPDDSTNISHPLPALAATSNTLQTPAVTFAASSPFLTCALQFMKRDGPGAKPLSDILEQCAQRNVDSSLTGLVEEVLRSCWEEEDKRPAAHQLAAIMQKRLRL